MIYTLTLNPALDYIVDLDAFTPGTVNRTAREMILGGGKGINVSVVLKRFGHESVALGFTAGFTGDEIIRQLTAFGCRENFIRLKSGLSRINVKIKAGEETELNGRGPDIDETDLNLLFERLEGLSKDDTLVLSGSVPPSVPTDIYRRIAERYDASGPRLVIDTSGEALLSALPTKPFLIKPNRHELESIAARPLASDRDVLAEAEKLQRLGARNVFVSLAGDGALLLTENGAAYKASAPVGTVVSSVGAGDSSVAGFLAAYVETNGDARAAFKIAVCAGSASAFSSGLASRASAEVLLVSLPDPIRLK